MEGGGSGLEAPMASGGLSQGGCAIAVDHFSGWLCLVTVSQRLPSFANDWLDFSYGRSIHDPGWEAHARDPEGRGRQKQNGQATARHEINNTMFIQKDQIQSPVPAGAGGHGALYAHLHPYIRMYTAYRACGASFPPSVIHRLTNTRSSPC